MRDFRLDFEREIRTGLAEAVLCEGKSTDQIVRILAAAGERPLFLTRLSERQRETIDAPLDYDPLSRTAIRGQPRALDRHGPVVVAAGTSDMPVAAEAVRTLAFHGVTAPVIADVGVAGVWRLMERLEDIRSQRIVIAVAGMEGALFSVLAGLVSAPVIAVPTSVGYGVAEGGRAALSSALASCAGGVVAVNVDNGFGGAAAALRILAVQERFFTAA